MGRRCDETIVDVLCEYLKPDGARRELDDELYWTNPTDTQAALRHSSICSSTISSPLTPEFRFKRWGRSDFEGLVRITFTHSFIDRRGSRELGHHTTPVESQSEAHDEYRQASEL